MENKAEQLMLDTVARHMLTQGERCANAYGYCLYENGDKNCAIGVLLVPGAAKELDNDPGGVSFDNIPASAFQPQFTGALRTLTGFHLGERLQRIHDRKDPKDWADCLIDLAEGCDLDTSVILNHSLTS